MNQEKILVIEDDQRLADLVIEYLDNANYQMQHAGTGQAGIDATFADLPDVVILDLMLPDMDGFDVCRLIRQKSNVPIIMLTAKGDAMDRILGLELGADDYLSKPFEPRELLARIRAILRREKMIVEQTPQDDGGGSDSEKIVFGRLKIDTGSRQVTLDNQLCDITSYQYELLTLFAHKAGRVLSRDYLMEQLKNQSLDAFDRSIDVHISRLRAAIEEDPKNPKRIITVRGAGYVFAKDQP